MTASTMAGTITFQGNANVPMRWWALARRGAVGQPGPRPSAKPTSGADEADDDAIRPQDEADVRSVAPIDSSIPRERMRRWASTVKPPIDTRAISSMPSVASASTMVDGLMTLLLATEAGW